MHTRLRFFAIFCAAILLATAGWSLPAAADTPADDINSFRLIAPAGIHHADPARLAVRGGPRPQNRAAALRRGGGR